MGRNILNKELINSKKCEELFLSNNRPKHHIYFISLILFCGVLGSLPTFYGYNFQHPFGILMSIIYSMFVIAIFFFLIRLFIEEKQKNIFYKKRHLFLLVLPLLIITIIFCILPIFTTKFIDRGDGGFGVRFNPFFYLVIFIPIFIGYVIFVWLIFLKKINIIKKENS